MGILLAAGAGKRFGGAKLLAKLADGTTVGHRACGNLIAAVSEVIAVVRPGDEEVARDLAAAGARVTACPDAQMGMGASLAHAVRAAGDAEAVMIALADMPWIRLETLRLVKAELERGEPLVVARHQGKRGHPVGFGRVHYPALMGLDNDGGAREVIARATRIRWIDVDDPGVLRDVDTPADLKVI